jgi:hypothetical protein
MRILLWVGLFVTAAATTIAVGLALLIAPAGTGTFLHGHFAVFPAPESRLGRTLYRVLGALLALFGGIYGLETGQSALRVLLGHP